MTIKSNAPQLDPQQQGAPKRAWSAPRVIEADLSDTQVSSPTRPNPTDSVYSFSRFGSGS